MATWTVAKERRRSDGEVGDGEGAEAAIPMGRWSMTKAAARTMAKEEERKGQGGKGRSEVQIEEA